MRWAALATAAAITLATPIAAAPVPADCAVTAAAVQLARSLEGRHTPKADEIRAALARAGITAATPLPNCAGTESAGNCPTTAASTLGWGRPDRSAEFTDPAELDAWGVYDGPGHAGNGRRTPDAVSVADGLLTITGTPDGDSGGMAWAGGRKFGRWEACVRSPKAAPDYHSVLLLWPDAENWPVGGEVDFMEIGDPERQNVEMFLHYGADNRQEQGSVDIDATQWHAWAVEWTPQRITAYVDGRKWFETAETGHFPPGPMHMTVQLDNFGGDLAAGGTQIVDWARQYPVDGSPGPAAAEPGNSE